MPGLSRQRRNVTPWLLVFFELGVAAVTCQGESGVLMRAGQSLKACFAAIEDMVNIAEAWVSKNLNKIFELRALVKDCIEQLLECCALCGAQ